MAKGIYNRLFQEGPDKLTNCFLANNFKELLDTEVENGTVKCLKMKKERASYLNGIYAAICQLSETYNVLKKEGHQELMHEFLSDGNCADYIVDRFAYMQVLSPILYKDYIEEAEKEDNIIDL